MRKKWRGHWNGPLRDAVRCSVKLARRRCHTTLHSPAQWSIDNWSVANYLPRIFIVVGCRVSIVCIERERERERRVGLAPGLRVHRMRAKPGVPGQASAV